MSKGPGYIMLHYLSSKKWHTEEEGCDCYRTAHDMDRAGPDNIEQDLGLWIARVRNNAKRWYKRYREDGKWVKVLIKPAVYWKIPGLIRWACAQSRGDTYRPEDVDPEFDSNYELLMGSFENN